MPASNRRIAGGRGWMWPSSRPTRFATTSFSLQVLTNSRYFCRLSKKRKFFSGASRDGALATAAGCAALARISASSSGGESPAPASPCLVMNWLTRCSVSGVTRAPSRSRATNLPSLTARRPKVDSAIPVRRQKSEILPSKVGPPAACMDSSLKSLHSGQCLVGAQPQGLQCKRWAVSHCYETRAYMPDVLHLIGNTPMIETRRLDTGPCRLFLKLENQNPGGSIKDRIALSMIEAAERAGQIKPGSLIVEATAGNTGLGLALVAAQKGYRLLIVVPDKMSQEKIFHLKAMGAEVVLTRSDVTKGHPEYYQDLAARLARETPGAFYINQFANPANPRAHEETTGPEIWEQMEHQVDAVVAGVGTGGTITGLSRFFERAAPQTDIVLADPEGSVLANYVKTGTLSRDVGSWLVEGIGEDFIAPVCDLSRVKKAYSVPDGEAVEVCRN